MPPATVAPYGTWRSPITADSITQGAVGLGQVALDGADTYWTELRPTERGRVALVRCDASGDMQDCVTAPHSVRSRVHEYGGGAFAVADGVIWYCNDADQRVYRKRPGGAPESVSPEGPWRFADLTADRRRGGVIAVREDHGGDGEPRNDLVALSEDGSVTVLASGRDFYAAPRLSEDGGALLWLSWDHPNMPWDGCTLSRAALTPEGAVASAETIAGGPDDALFQPEWMPDGSLCFVSDRSGWWNLYRHGDDGIAALCPMETDFGLPQWMFNMRTYGAAGAGRLLAVYHLDGIAKLAEIDLRSGVIDTVATPFVDIQGLVSGDGRAVMIGGGLREPPVVGELDLESLQLKILRRSAKDAVPPGVVSIAEAVTFESADGRMAHAFYFPPCNADFEAPDGDLPPLIVRGHGGPTGQSSCAFALKIQFWTSRGFAVLDVNYGGSTGFGRAYRNLLKGRWGVVDVEDTAAGARWLVERGLAHPECLAITGGSAGGYTTLCALAFGDVFRAGASHYGIGDLKALARDTHKFESRYLDRLIGKWPADKAIYEERSPLLHADRLNCPVIFFQGSEDKVVPPNQAEAMVDALRRKGIPVAYVLFDGEAHGFRQAANIKRALETELAFYGRVFGFEPADAAEPIEIENLD